MIDQQQRLSGVVKDEISKLAPTLGVDKSQVGFAVNPTFAPVAQPGGQTGLYYAWVVTITLRVPLLGYPPVLMPVIVPSPLGTLPSDNDFRGAVKMGLENASKTYTEVMADVPSASSASAVKAEIVK